MTTKLRRYLTLLALLSGGAACLPAQDTRQVTEPSMPNICEVYVAPLRSTADGPAIAEDVTVQDAESAAETDVLTKKLKACIGKGAVELALGKDTSFSAFLLNPISIPAKAALVIDGGVTVYGSRDPANYQDSSSNNPDGNVCGTVGNYAIDKGCLPLFSLTKDAGIYGYGVIDGQGHRKILYRDSNNPNNGYTWWDLAFTKKNTNKEQANPRVIGGGSAAREGSNLIFYKITVRNPPFHSISLSGDGITVWGMKVQAPWSIPNTDGFDIRGTNFTIADTTVAVGDQEIAISTFITDTANITVKNFRGFSKGGITILAGGETGDFKTRDLLFENISITGGIASLAGTTVNGVPESTLMGSPYNLKSYAQALPTATGDLKAIQITTNINAAAESKLPNVIQNIAYKNVCIQDVNKPVNITPIVPFVSGQQVPTLKGVTFQNVHILPVTSQFPAMKQGIPVSPAAPGGYGLVFQAYPSGGYYNGITLDNVVVDDLVTGSTSLAQITAIGNRFTTATNIYPPILNNLTSSASVANPALTLDSNSYVAQTATSSPSWAYSCSMPAFTTGDLYISLGQGPATGNETNLQAARVAVGSSVTLNAVVQPVMSQTTYLNPDGYGTKPGVLAVGSPALTQPIQFWEGDTLLGSAKLSANGTFASLTLTDLKPGSHIYQARYPTDSYYKAMMFGSVTVEVPGTPAVKSGQKSDPTLLTVISPKIGDSVFGPAVAVEFQASASVKPSSLRVELNGRNITNLLQSQCRGTACPYTTHVSPNDGLIAGVNTLILSAEGEEGTSVSRRIQFHWAKNQPGNGQLGATLQLGAPTYNFTTLTPGGYESTGRPWFQINNTGLHGTTRTYPVQAQLCGGQGYVYTLVQIDRNTLDEVSSQCLAPNQVDAALAAVPPTQFAVFGTNSTYNADWQHLNTLPIGGTDFRSTSPSPEAPYGYMIIGIGQAPYGVGVESYNTGYEVNEVSLAQIQGVLTRNAHSLFDYHPADYVTYSIDGPNKKAIFDGQTFTPQGPLPSTGFWVFPFTRNAFAPLAGTQGVLYDATKASDLAAMNTLLGSLTWRQMAVVIGWGKQPGVALATSLNPVVTKLASMGIPYPTLQEMTDDNSAFAALVTPDPTIAIALPNRRVPLSLTPSANGQKGQLVGSLGRDKYYLFRPAYTAQADLSSNTPMDASFLKTIWLQSAAWPMMDTQGHVNAYKYLSNRILHFVWQNNLPAGPTDDIRYVYTIPTENTLLHGTKPDVDPVYTTYPENGKFTNPDTGETYTFTQAELSDVAKQLRAEINALADVIPFLDKSDTGANLRGRLISDSDAWLPAWVTSNTLTLNKLPYVNKNAAIGFSFDDIVYNATALTPNPMSLDNPLLAPIEGMVTSLVSAVGSIGAMDVNNNGVPTASYAVNTTIQDFTFNYLTWIGNADSAYNQILDLALSDWNRLQILSLAIRGNWYVDDYSVLDHSPTLELGANRFFYTNFMRTYYSHDAYWFVEDIIYTTLIGSEKDTCETFGGCTPVCNPVYPASTSQNTSGVFSSFPPDPTYPYIFDLYQIAGPIRNQNMKTMSVDTPGSDVGELLFGTNQANGQFAMPKDLWFTMGALPIRSGANTPQYGYGGCILY